MPLDPGTLWARVEIRKPTSTPNELGEPVLSWSTFATVSANVAPLSSREAVQYGEVLGIMTHKVTIRYLPGLLSSMRVIYRDRTLEIGQVNERERLWIHDIICTERRPA